MKILASCRRRMIERAEQDAPNETCGFFTGRPGLIEEIHPLKNVSADAHVRYEFEPLEHFRTLKRLERGNADCGAILGVYHSHPASQAYPSTTDVGRALLPDGTDALYPDYLYIIVSLQTPGSPVMRAFRIRSGGRIQEEDLLTEDDA